MPEINLPEVKLPDIKLPDAWREMSRDDIVHAARDVRLPKVELPKRLELPEIDLSKVDLPKPIADRLPGRRRRNPIMPFIGLAVVGAIAAALYWLFTSAETGPRVRSAMNDLKSRVTGQRHDLIRYDDEQDLGSLLGDENRTTVGGTDYTSPTVAAGGLGEGAGTTDFGAVPAGQGEEASSRSVR
jgi:hypothetical protein